MAYIAQVPDGLLTLDADAWVIDTNAQHVLTGFFDGAEETTGDIEATNEGGDGGIAEAGETVTVPKASGDVQGTYVGPVTLSSANVTVGIPALAGINVKLNDIDGHAIRGEDGSNYFVSDQPLEDDRLGATLSVSVLGQNIELLDVPLSEINESIAGELDSIADSLGPIAGLPFSTLAATVRSGADLTQQVLDAVTLNVAEGDGTLPVVCFARGTLIMTDFGAVPVEELSEGMLVLTRDHGLQPVRWIGGRKINGNTLHLHPNMRPIRICAGALGENTPAQDLLVSPQHRILVRSKIAQRMFGTTEVLVAAKQLCQLDGIDIADDVSEVEYFHFLFDQHEVVYSNGAESESLYTGPEALKSVGAAALEEIFTLFPQLKNTDTIPSAARELPSGRKARKLAVRHRQHNKPLVS
ncbi:Hint domain-containing protein [Paracoccus onubensis]|uniref:Hint domain-containing protein n=1 Tax=Paracoccus onubensis TaxID=1675788 RepID=UPI002731FD54|nr:Hint domain-containing protein [Paracoccus onubensis]MDP0929620.1 Hint domain-containing protein [Paracoccus onubensis]